MRYRSETTVNQYTSYAYKTVLQSGGWRRRATCEGGLGANRTKAQTIEPEQAGVNLGTAFLSGPGVPHQNRAVGSRAPEGTRWPAPPCVTYIYYYTGI